MAVLSIKFMLSSSKFKRHTVHTNFERYALENILLMNKMNFDIKIYSESNLFRLLDFCLI
jgi:hypothetical protein